MDWPWTETPGGGRGLWTGPVDGQNSGLSASSWTGVDWLWTHPWTQAVDWLWTGIWTHVQSTVHRAVDCGLDRGLHGHGRVSRATTEDRRTRVQRASIGWFLIRLGIHLLPHSRNAT